VLGVSWEEGWVAAEWIEGPTVKAAVRGRDTDREGSEGELRGLMRRIGKAVGRLHGVGVVHGDLTTSNMMLKPEGQSGNDGEKKEEGGLEGEIVLIDFGLAAQTVQEEDRAVDLYVLERAFGSTHPREEGMFGEVLEGYREAFPKGSKGTLRRLEDVRMRGRKKSMIG
jgi:TP53 regulating kinase-like protein